MKPVLCPSPRTLVEGCGCIDAPARIRLNAAAVVALSRAAEVSAAIMGGICKVALDPDAAFAVTVERDPALHGEAYSLRCGPEGCHLRARTEQGVSRAFATLAQIFLGGKIPALDIDDAPALPLRGYMLDASRDRVPARRTLLHLLDALWLCKYNQFQLYVEHTFAFDGHEPVWEHASPFTRADIAWLQDQCAARGIELVPNLNSLGHFGRWLRLPAYRHLSECPDGVTLPNGRVMPPGGTTLFPGPDSLAFLDGLYAQYLPLFDSHRFNAGMDEPWELGLGRSADACQQRGKHRVYLDHLLAVARLAKKHGKALQFWADIVLEAPELVAELPEGITGMIWGYENGHPFEAQCAAFEKAGVPFVVCPGTSGWNSLAGRWENARANIAQAAAAARAHGAMGILLTDWGDNGHHQPLCVSLPPLAVCAELGWRGETGCDVEAALNILLLRDATGICGHAITTMGSLCERHFRTRIHNCAAAWKLFFAKPEELPEILTSEDAAAIPAFRAELAALRVELASARPTAFGGKLVCAELDLTARMLDAGVRRFQGEEMGGEIGRIADDYAELWLSRSERGGLEDSLARIAAIS